MSCINNCQVCPNLIASTNVAISGSVLQVTIPTMTINDNQKICLLIAQAIPSGAGVLPINIINGSNTLTLINKCGKPVYADQIRSRRIYVLCANTATPSATVKTNNLCPTAFVPPQLTGTATA